MQRIVLVQDYLTALKLVPVLVRLITMSNDHAVIEEAINVSTAMLIGGNPRVRVLPL